MTLSRIVSVSLLVPLTLGVLMTQTPTAAEVDARATPWIIAHRGASHAAPENTLAAFRLAWEEDADGIEGDFRLTRDGKVVCIHDADTKRTAGRKLVVSESTFDELRTLDVGAWKDPKYAGERIATLDEALAVVPAGKRIYVELKAGPAIVAPVKAAIERSGLDAGQIAIISFDADTVAECRRVMPNITANWLTGYKRRDDRTVTPTADTVLRKLDACGASGLGSQADRGVLTGEFVERLRGGGFGFHCWTVNDADDARYFRAFGVDSITTDRPAFIRAALNER